mmetsp:Transcript_2672/g.4331  ORF Transcript_2672/g.4331 Transcript_2672/m.4331 type:complete len:411 (+) Transcript_2672:790-2022(+)
MTIITRIISHSLLWFSRYHHRYNRLSQQIVRLVLRLEGEMGNLQAAVAAKVVDQDEMMLLLIIIAMLTTLRRMIMITTIWIIMMMKILLIQRINLMMMKKRWGGRCILHLIIVGEEGGILQVEDNTKVMVVVGDHQYWRGVIIINNNKMNGHYEGLVRQLLKQKYPTVEVVLPDDRGSNKLMLPRVVVSVVMMVVGVATELPGVVVVLVEVVVAVRGEVVVVDRIINEVQVMELILVVVNRSMMDITIINNSSNISNLTLVVPSKDHFMDQLLWSLLPPPRNPPIRQDSMEGEIQLMMDHLLRNTPSTNLLLIPSNMGDGIQPTMNPPPPSTPFMKLPLLPCTPRRMSRGSSTEDEILLLHRSKGCIQDPFHTRTIIVYMKVFMMVVRNSNLINSSSSNLKIILGLNRFQ